MEFVRDGSTVTVLLDGHPQSCVDLEDPGFLGFEYVEHLATALAALAPRDMGGRVRVTHVGGGGLTLPRWVEHTFPGSPQIVLEPDAALTGAVRRELPLPRGHRIRVRSVGGEVGLPLLRAGSADVVVLDAYAAGRVPAALTTVQWLGEVARVLTPKGILLANLADEPGRRWTARFLAGAAGAGLPEQWLIGTHDILKGRRFGNLVLVAARGPVDRYTLARAVARVPLPSGIRDGRPLASGRRPFDGPDAEDSPAPPDPGRWRVR